MLFCLYSLFCVPGRIIVHANYEMYLNLFSEKDHKLGKGTKQKDKKKSQKIETFYQGKTGEDHRRLSRIIRPKLIRNLDRTESSRLIIWSSTLANASFKKANRHKILTGPESTWENMRSNGPFRSEFLQHNHRNRINTSKEESWRPRWGRRKRKVGMECDNWNEPGPKQALHRFERLQKW